MSRTSLALAVLLATTGIGHAQQQIEWKQTLNIPKGQNIPRDRADMLGIEFGDSYAEAKAKLEKLDAEGIQQKGRPEFGLTEDKKIFDFRAPGHSVITASYVGTLKLTRSLPGNGKQQITEYITLHLSAPSSGHQVVAMQRDIYYPDADQPQLSALLDSLKAKFKTDPLVGRDWISFQFDNGHPAARRADRTDCRAEIEEMQSLQRVQQVNRRGDCDVVMLLDITRGVSQNHVRILKFAFGDNERMKANSIADYTYISDYLKSMQSRKLGAPPKL